MNESINKKRPFDFDARNLAGDLTAVLTMALISGNTTRIFCHPAGIPGSAKLVGFADCFRVNF